jgi:hypothetical protein
MSEPSNGITPEVIRSVMPPYHLSPDLLQATLAALPRPPEDATAAWRQARIAAQVLITRELADTVVTQAHAPGVEIPLICRLARAAATLMQTAAMLERSLNRQQQ